MTSYDQERDRKLVGTDHKGIELRSVYSWTEGAVERILRVPSGYMRDKTQERVENLALERRAETVDLELVEAGIELGKKIMEEVVASMNLDAPAPAAVASPLGSSETGVPAEKKCPFASLAGEGEKSALKEAFSRLTGTAGGEGGKCPVSETYRTVSPLFDGAVEQVLNETGLMFEMDKKRKEFKGEL